MPLTEDGGFVPVARFFRLAFDGELEGLWVLCRSASIEIYEEMAALADREWHNPPTADERAALSGLFEGFAGVLAQWNLRQALGPEPGAGAIPVPCTVGGIRGQEPALIFTIITVWLDEMARVLRAGATVEDSANPSAAQMEESLAQLAESLDAVVTTG